MEGNQLVKIDTLQTLDDVVAKCLPIQMKDSLLPSESFEMAQGILSLRDIFNRQDIQKLVLAMKDTRLGFVTDRSEKALAISRNKGKELKPYHYNTIRDACIEALLSGYRIVGNEFNVIAGNFYAAKNGKLRRIREYPGVTDFEFTTTTPTYESDGSAKVQCWAGWKMNGQTVRLGYSENGKEDKLVIKIRVNKMMGEDAVVGKALSKLFTRVLIRLGGKLSAGDFGEPDPGNMVDVTPKDEEGQQVGDDAVNRLLNKPRYKMDQDESLVTGILKRDPKSLPRTIEDNARYISTVKKERPELFQMVVDHWNHFFPNQPFPRLSKREPRPREDDVPGQETDGQDSSGGEFRADWINLKKSGYIKYINENLPVFETCRESEPATYQEAMDKWADFYPNQPWPLLKQDDTAEKRNHLRESATTIPDQNHPQESGSTENTMDDEVSECRKLLQEWRIKHPDIFDSVAGWLGYDDPKTINIQLMDIVACNDMTERMASAYKRREKGNPGPPA